MVVEMRTYKTKPGMREQFLAIFRSEDTFFFMRGFPDLESRERMKAGFYEGDLWKSRLEALLMPMLDKSDVVLVDDPNGLVRWSDTCA
jgi:hypothetical protein